MPTYLWKCNKCEITSEVTVPVAEYNTQPMLPEHDCEHNWTRLLAPVLFTLKGTGWARDNYTKEKK